MRYLVGVIYDPTYILVNKDYDTFVDVSDWCTRYLSKN